MFRFSKQLEISRLINKCKTTDELCQWFRNVVEEIGVENSKRILSNGFLQFKSHLNNQQLDKLLASKPTQGQISTNFSCNIDDNKIDKGNETQSKNVSKLDLVSDHVFFHISFYLLTKESLNLSMTSHSFHKKTQNNECFCASRLKLLRGKCSSVNLNEKILNTIDSNNCIMECMHKYTQIDINTVTGYQYSNLCCNKCPLSCVVDKINNNNHINYDLLWFKTIWSNITYIYISNQFGCVLKHVPISWILENKNQVLKPIKVLGAASVHSES